MSHVFISYVRDDAKLVDQLVSELRRPGIDIWLDRERINPGKRWKESLRDAIQNGSFFLACFSANSTARERSHMNEELTLAIEELRLRSTDRVWFLPVLLSACNPPSRPIGAGETLRDLQWTDLTKNWKSGIARLIGTISPRPSLTSVMEAQLVGEIRAGTYVDVAPDAFFRIAVASGQVSADDLRAFVESALIAVESSADYFMDGEQDDISAVGGRVFIWRTGTFSVFESARKAVAEVLHTIRDSYLGVAKRSNAPAVRITIRGLDRFFDVKGLAGVRGRTWIGFDLRS